MNFILLKNKAIKSSDRLKITLCGYGVATFTAWRPGREVSIQTLRNARKTPGKT